MGQLLPAASEAPQSVMAAKSPRGLPAAGVTDSRDSEMAPDPVLVRSTVRTSRLKRPRLPNETLLGETFSAGGTTAGATVIVQLAVTVPAAVPDASATCAVKVKAPAE